jgi:long-chain acyl-CoA synthetase
VVDIVRQHAPGREISQETTLDDLGLSSLERVELLVELEQHLGTGIDETQLTGTSTVAGLKSLTSPPAPTEFPSWNRKWYARAARKATLAPVLLPLTRCFAHIKVSGGEHLKDLRGPVIFAPNHQSHMDTPVILAALPARFRHRTAVAMWKEYFDAHFFPDRHSGTERLTNSLEYYSVTLLFNAFPLPQTEARAGESLRYMGELVSDGWSILFFPEGERTATGEIGKFQAGIGFVAARLGVPVIPVRLTGVEKVLHRADRFPRPGPVKVAFGKPLFLKGENFEELASQVRRAVSEL